MMSTFLKKINVRFILSANSLPWCLTLELDSCDGGENVQLDIS
jgi:hypothetical protein